ncbi:hypothetical protein Acr_18g0011670 [Actinidia rufa]|uniref:Uncharacterized protein n=1 Tax=Actinidia rufa TaxID=165716 RepID=A0A7J0G869_9ERIC|nr:hypothetical protein Acr_18g0011670 [Actinidia rufa]
MNTDIESFAIWVSFSSPWSDRHAGGILSGLAPADYVCPLLCSLIWVSRSDCIVVVKIRASNQQSQLLGFLGTGPQTIKGRPAQTNRNEGPGILVGRLIKPSIPPRLRARRRQHFGSRRTDGYSDSGYGELRGGVWQGFMLNVGLVSPQSRGFGDKQPLERSRATSSVMVLGRRTCLSRWRIYPTSVAPLLEVARWNSWDFE